MPIKFTFNLDKAIAALAYLSPHDGARLDMFLSLKRLYAADRRALASWGKTITGDKMISMNKGPLLSVIYDLFKGRGTADNLREWKSYFGDTVNDSVSVRRPVNVDILSEEEKNKLNEAKAEIDSVAPWEVADFLHAAYPEWEFPSGGSKPIDPVKILRATGRTEDEIRMFEESSEAFNHEKKMFSHLARG